MSIKTVMNESKRIETAKAILPLLEGANDEGTNSLVAFSVKG